MLPTGLRLCRVGSRITQTPLGTLRPRIEYLWGLQEPCAAGAQPTSSLSSECAHGTPETSVSLGAAFHLAPAGTAPSASHPPRAERLPSALSLQTQQCLLLIIKLAVNSFAHLRLRGLSARAKCVHVCVHVCVPVGINVGIYVGTYTHMHVYM